MAATQPPVIIDATVPARAGVQPGVNYGPFEYSGPSRLYAVLISQSSPAPLNVYKSTDSGASWTNQDTANRPANIGDYDVWQQGNTLYLLYRNLADSGKLTIITFDAATDAFGAVGVGGPISTGDLEAYLVRLSTGVLRAFYSKSTGLNKSGLFYADFSAGAWGVENTVVAETAGHQALIRGIVLDSSNVTHLLYSDFQAGIFPTQSDLTYLTVTAGGVVSAPSTVESGAPGQRYFGGHTVLWTDPSDSIEKIVMPSLQGPNNQLAGVWVGSPSSAPVWTFTLVDSLTWSVDESDSYGFAFVSGSTLYLFWISLDTNFVDPADIIDRMYYASNDGSGWTSPVLFYNEVTDPQLQDPGINPFDQFLHTVSVTKLVSGLFSPLTALEENSFCAGYNLLDGSCGVTITPASLPAAQAGVPFSLTVEAIDIPGQFWEYSISSGSLPDGLALNTTTTTGPIISDDGVQIAGTPVLTEWSGPVTTTFTMHVRLVA